MAEQSFPLQDSLSALDEQFRKMHTLAPHALGRNNSVSGWSVGEHLEHICIVAGGFGVSLLTGRGPRVQATHPEYRPMVLMDGSIPRGQVKAPPVAHPKSIPDVSALVARLSKTHDRLRKAADQPADRSADHPLLGTLTRDEVFRFLVVHNAHHLAIIDDCGF